MTKGWHKESGQHRAAYYKGRQKINYEQIAGEIMENYPEYSSSSLQCTAWSYKKGIFKFLEVETGKTHIITTKDVAKALPKFVEHVNLGRSHFYGLNHPLDAGDYDAGSTDGLVQMTIFGKIIYG